MKPIFLLDLKAVKQLKCFFCLKKKAETISPTQYTEFVPVCVRCLLWVEGLDGVDPLTKEYKSVFPHKYGALPNLKDILQVLRNQPSLEM